ncbi:MAG: ATP-binding cassette domain-containing protein [Clostridia bacterium]|nr:ATP-binding cassette domain-containing protein [Clostridia bacterium]
MIKVENVSYIYKGSNKKILDNLNFEINKGEIVAIVGKNGSGKSTIGKLITGIIKLKKGNILIDDIDISKNKNSKMLKNKIGIVFQNPENQIIFNNIYDELSFSLNGLPKAEIEKRVNMALKQVGMLNEKDYDLYSLSLGQKQRIMIAEVLAKNPEYIIFDEVTTMIDSEGKDEIYEIIKNLKNKGYTIICITNLADEILLADRTLILSDRNIACEIKKDELITKAPILKEFGIKEPTILKILIELKKHGIDLNLKEFSVTELVNLLKGKIINEKFN